MYAAALRSSYFAMIKAADHLISPVRANYPVLCCIAVTNNRIEISVLWNDIDVIEVRVAAWNGRFGGTVEAYVPVGGLAEAAAKLSGFPHTPSDERELIFGAFGPEWAGGAAKLRFYCKGSAGRSFVECWFESEHGSSQGVETAHFHAPVEASAIDKFVSEMNKLEAELSGVAQLNTVLVG